MSQSFVPFNDNASASRKFHTIQKSNGADTVEQYVMPIGEAYLPTYTACALATVLTTANSHVFELMAGASLRVGVKRITMRLVTAATATANMQWGLFRLTTAGTGGTAYTPNPRDAADAASGATFMTLPSSKGTEGALMWLDASLVHQTITTVGVQRIVDLDFTSLGAKALWIPAGTTNGLCFKNLTGVDPAAVYIDVDFVESIEDS
jgi:hypothetical protein